MGGGRTGGRGVKDTAKWKRRRGKLLRGGGVGDTRTGRRGRREGERMKGEKEGQTEKGETEMGREIVEEGEKNMNRKK